MDNYNEVYINKMPVYVFVNFNRPKVLQTDTLKIKGR